MGDPDDPGPEDPGVVQRRRRRAALITSAVAIAAVAIALGVGRLTYPSGGGAATGPGDIPPLPTTVPGATVPSTPGRGTALDVPFAPSGAAYLQVVVASSATTGGGAADIVATATLDNETGALIDAPGPCTAWLHLALGTATPTTPAAGSCQLPPGFSEYKVPITLPAASGTYPVTAQGLPAGIRLVQPPSVTVTAG